MDSRSARGGWDDGVGVVMKTYNPSPRLIEWQKQHVFRACFEDGFQQIDVSGPTSYSVMDWGLEQGYVLIASKTEKFATYRLTKRGREFLTTPEASAP